MSATRVKRGPKRVFKIVAFVFGGLVALLAVILAVLLMSFDSVRIKDELARLVMEKKQRTLTIQGDLSLSLWPNIGVRMGKTTLSEQNSDKLFMALDQAHVSVAVWPLLSRQLIVDEVQLSGVQASLVKHKDGHSNFEDLLSKEDDSNSSIRFDVAGLKLDATQITWVDELAQREFVLKDAHLQTGQIANLASGKLSLVGRVTGNAPKLDAGLALHSDYRFDLEKRDVLLKDLSLQFKGAAASFSDLTVDLVAGSIHTQSPESAMELSRLKMSVQGQTADSKATAKVEVPALTLTPKSARGATLTAEGDIKNGATQTEFKASLDGVDGTAQQIQAQKFVLNFANTAGSRSTSGQITSPLNLDLTQSVFGLNKIAGEVLIKNPSLPKQKLQLPVSGRMSANWNAQTAVAELATTIDESHVNLRLDVLAFAPLRTQFDVSADQFNVDLYRAQDDANAKSDPAGETTIDLSGLRGITTAGRLQIGALQVMGVHANNVSAQLAIANGVLKLSPLNANLYDGTLSGSLTLDAKDNAVSLQQSLVNVGMAPLLRDAMKKDPLDGHGTINFDVATTGPNVSSMKRNLRGQASMKLRDGAIKGINLAKTLRLLKARLALNQDMTQAANKEEKTDFSELTASFNIQQGIAKNSDLMAKSPLLRLGGNGQIDLGESTIDYVAKVAVVGTTTGQDGKELAQLKGITVPVRLQGPFDKLKYSLEVKDLVSDATKAQVKQQVDAAKEQVKEQVKAQSNEIKDQARDKLKDKLKGLLGQ